MILRRARSDKGKKKPHVSLVLRGRKQPLGVVAYAHIRGWEFLCWDKSYYSWEGGK